MLGFENQHQLADSGPIVDEDVEDMEQELDLQTIRDERESQNQSRLEHRREVGSHNNLGGSMGSQISDANEHQDLHGGADTHEMRHNAHDMGMSGMGPMMQGNHNGGMVDSYEIYGENQPDDSDIEAEEEVVHVSNKRGGRLAAKTKAGRQASNKGRSGKNNDSIGGDSDGIMISGEQIIEPSKMVKNDYKGKGANTASSHQGKRRISQNRESSGVKKTNIEVLDHETPIEQYQQYYNQMQEGSGAPPQELQAQPLMQQQQYNQINALLPGSDPNGASGGGLASGLNGLSDIHNTAESDDLFNKLIVNLNSNGAL